MPARGPDDDEAQLLGRAVAALRERAGLNQAEAGAKIGVSAQGWAKYEQGKAPSIFRPDTQKRLTDALDADIDELMEYRDRLAEGSVITSRPIPANDLRAVSFEAKPPVGMVAVYGLAAGRGERIALAEGSEIRFVPLHPAQRGYRRVGAAEIVGESMYPRYKPRELAYFIFDLTPPRGEDVIVELNDGTALIKEYAGRTPTHLMLKEFCPEERTFDLPLAEVKTLHAVVGR